ncbi:hypothetical protein CDAR_244091 [Caerostris darwini]|uniref:Uncharacterized protein n=1 Tax=Caerostris darwini TaxID=1538125 RepID=A0AAV4RHU8_9ARAC|nr:hypothetical protein CDAR_244091 [Caerostris darwini]
MSLLSVPPHPSHKIKPIHTPKARNKSQPRRHCFGCHSSAVGRTPFNKSPGIASHPSSNRRRFPESSTALSQRQRGAPVPKRQRKDKLPLCPVYPHPPPSLIPCLLESLPLLFRIFSFSGKRDVAE